MRIIADSSEYLNPSEKEFVITVLPDLGSALKLYLTPAQVNVLPGTIKDMSLAIVNNAPFDYNVSVTSSMKTNLPSIIDDQQN